MALRKNLLEVKEVKQENTKLQKLGSKTTKSTAAKSLTDAIAGIKDSISELKVDPRFLARHFLNSNEDFKQFKVEQELSQIKSNPDKLNIGIILGSGHVFSLDLSALDVIIFFDLNPEVFLYVETVRQLMQDSTSRKEFERNFQIKVKEVFKVNELEAKDMLDKLQDTGNYLNNFFLVSEKRYQQSRVNIKNKIFIFKQGNFLDQHHVDNLHKVIGKEYVVKYINITNLPAYCKPLDKAKLLVSSLQKLANSETSLQLSYGGIKLYAQVMRPSHFKLMLKYVEKCDFEFYLKLEDLVRLDYIESKGIDMDEYYLLSKMNPSSPGYAEKILKFTRIISGEDRPEDNEMSKEKKPTAAELLAKEINEIKVSLTELKVDPRFLGKNYFTSNEDFKRYDVERQLSQIKRDKEKLNIGIVLGSGHTFSLDLSALDVIVFFDVNPNVFLYIKTIHQLIEMSNSRQEFISNFYINIANAFKITDSEEVDKLFENLQAGKTYLNNFFLSSEERYQQCRKNIKVQVFAFYGANFLDGRHIDSLVAVMKDKAIVKYLNVTNLPNYCRDPQQGKLLLDSLRKLYNEESILQLSTESVEIGRFAHFSRLIQSRHFGLILKHVEKYNFNFHMKLEVLERIELGDSQSLSLDELHDFSSINPYSSGSAVAIGKATAVLALELDPGLSPSSPGSSGLFRHLPGALGSAQAAVGVTTEAKEEVSFSLPKLGSCDAGQS